jgi:hypothetical protein
LFREEANISGWVDYFVRTLATAMGTVREIATQAEGNLPARHTIRPLDPRKQRVMALFTRKNKVTTNEIAAILSLSPRMARVIVQNWIKEGWVEVSEQSKKARSYILKRKHN